MAGRAPSSRAAITAPQMKAAPYGSLRPVITALRRHYGRPVPLDSNALRVVTRLGLATVGKNYRSTYQRAQEVLARAIPRDSAWPIVAYALLRQHGQELCRRRAPACERCPLRARCPSATV